MFLSNSHFSFHPLSIHHSFLAYTDLQSMQTVYMITEIPNRQFPSTRRNRAPPTINTPRKRPEVERIAFAWAHHYNSTSSLGSWCARQSNGERSAASTSCGHRRLWVQSTSRRFAAETPRLARDDHDRDGLVFATAPPAEGFRCTWW